LIGGRWGEDLVTLGQSLIWKKKEARLAKSISKSDLIQKIVQQRPNEIARKDVKGVIEAVAEIGYKEPLAKLQ
jgi:hypothetical protein